jgi:hypothetical protein
MVVVLSGVTSSCGLVPCGYCRPAAPYNDRVCLNIKAAAREASMPARLSLGRAILAGSIGLLALLVTSPSIWTAGEKGTFTGPWDLAALRRPPKVTVAEGGKTLTALYYEGEPYRGRPTRVFAYLAPEQACPPPLGGWAV